MNYISSASYNDSKKHYEILDGLRGVAAVVSFWVISPILFILHTTR